MNVCSVPNPVWHEREVSECHPEGAGLMGGLTYGQKKHLTGWKLWKRTVCSSALRKLGNVSDRGCPKNIKEANLFAKGGNSTG